MPGDRMTQAELLHCRVRVMGFMLDYRTWGVDARKEPRYGETFDSILAAVVNLREAYRRKQRGECV